MSLLGLCRQSADVQRRVETNQASGGIGATWTTVYTGLPCSLQVYTGKSHGHVAEHFSQMQMRVDYAAYFPGTYNFQINDRVYVSGIYYLINACGDMAGRGRITVAYLTRVDQ